MLNKVFLQGRLVADPELRHTQQGTPVASYRLAVDRGYKSKDPNAQNADFINVVSWRNTAEFVSRYFTKGRMMLVEGRLQMRDYTDRDGNRRVAAEVVTDNVFFCDSPRRDGQPSRRRTLWRPPGRLRSLWRSPCRPRRRFRQLCAPRELRRSRQRRLRGTER